MRQTGILATGVVVYLEYVEWMTPALGGGEEEEEEGGFQPQRAL